MGASAIFIEDQVAPKRCGHMAGKDVIPAEQMVAKIKAAAGARRSKDFFLIARTDARAVHGLDEALRRGEQYLEAGADGIFIEAPQTVAGTGAGRPRVPGRAADRQHAGRRRPDAGAAAGRTEGDGLCHGGLSDHADLSRRAHDRAGARRHQGRDGRAQAATASTSPASRTSPTTTNGRASRTNTRAGAGNGMSAGDRTIAALLLALALAAMRDRVARRPRCGSRSAASRRCSTCRSRSPTGSAISRTRASTSRSPISPAARARCRR